MCCWPVRRCCRCGAERARLKLGQPPHCFSTRGQVFARAMRAALVALLGCVCVCTAQLTGGLGGVTGDCAAKVTFAFDGLLDDAPIAEQRACSACSCQGVARCDLCRYGKPERSLFSASSPRHCPPVLHAKRECAAPQGSCCGAVLVCSVDNGPMQESTAICVAQTEPSGVKGVPPRQVGRPAPQERPRAHRRVSMTAAAASSVAPQTPRCVCESTHNKTSVTKSA